MAIPASGAISLDDIQTEWGGSNPIGMSEYYGDGDYVYDGAADGDDNAIPESGAIDISDFYDTTAATVLTISSNTNNYNIKSAVQSAGADLNTPVLLTIASGVTVGAADNSAPAMKTDTGWGSGVSITITNQGSIVGGAGSDTSGNPSSGGGSGGQSRPNWPGFGHPMYGYPGGAGSGASAQAGSSNNGGIAFEHSQTGDNNLSVVLLRPEQEQEVLLERIPLEETAVVVAAAVVRELNTALEAVLLLLRAAQAAAVRLMVQAEAQTTEVRQVLMATQHKAVLVVLVVPVLI